MKRIFIVVIASMLAMSLSAQKIGGGLQLGTGYSWLSVNSKQAESVSGKGVFIFGAFVDYGVTDNFAFSFGANLLMDGGTVKYDNFTHFNWDDDDYLVAPNSEISYKLQHIELPFSIKGMTQEIGYITYFARIGGVVSFSHRVRADIDGVATKTSNLLVADDTESLNIRKSVNPFNVGWLVGGGIEYSLGGSTAIIAELIFSQKFIGIGKDKITDPGKSVSIKPNVIGLKVGVKF